MNHYSSCDKSSDDFQCPCNGTKYIIKKLHKNFIQAEIAIGKYKGNKILIPRIIHISNKNEFPFTVRRKQFPIKAAFAITSNKSQGQTLDKVGVYLPTNFFTHGQVYVAFSRVKSSTQLRICTNKSKFIVNNVYNEIYIIVLNY